MNARACLRMVVVCLVAQNLFSGSNRPVTPLAMPHFEAVLLAQEDVVHIDGKLGEEVWRTAAAITEFVQRDPHEGAAPSFSTEVRVAYDKSALYVAVSANDPDPGKIVRMLTRRDSDSPSDWIRVMFDSFHDRRTAYEFAVNPAGVRQDRYWFNDDEQDRSWDAVWDVGVTTDGSGWRAEFRIPFSQLRFDPSRGNTFGFAVVRQIGRLNETCTWPLLAKSAQGYVSSFGELRGLDLERSPKRLEVVPYLVSQLRTQPAEPGNPFVQAKDPVSAAGVDLKYALTPGLTLTATINPDFGQVEADPAVVNLTAFETFFSERRPFFVEGSGVFRFNLDCNDGSCTGLFYSRRIGRAPQGDPSAPERGFSSAPAQTTILGAAKLTGHIGSFSIGALNAITSEERAQMAVGDSRYEKTVEPLTSYTVVRATREFSNQSSLGFMTTATNRRLTDDVSFLAGQAYAGGIDWDWRLGKGRYSLSGNWAGSTVRGSQAAIDRLQRNNVHSFQRPDADHVRYDPTRTALNGHTGMISFSKIAGEHIRFNTNASFKSPGFDTNDLGYMQRADTISFGNWLQWRHDKPSRWLRSFRINFNQWNGWNMDGDRQYRGGNINAHARFTSNWSTGAGINFNQAGTSDRITRGGPSLLRNPEIGFWHYIESDDRKSVSFGVQYFYGNDFHRSRSFDFNPGITFRPTTALSVSGGLGYNRNIDDYQWVEEVGDSRSHYVFAHLQQTTVGLTSRVNYTITPTLSVQIYGQPFVSAGAYSGFKELVRGRATKYEDRFAPFGYTGNPDFNYRSFRTTNVLRWEYKPGSILFVVWQQGREDVLGHGDFRFGRDFGGIFSTPAHNVFLVKLLYWLSL